MWKNEVRPLIQHPVEPSLAAISWNNCFLCDAISLSHGCGGILAHFFPALLQSLRFAAFVYAQLSIRLRSALWTIVSMCAMVFDL